MFKPQTACSSRLASQYPFVTPSLRATSDNSIARPNTLCSPNTPPNTRSSLVAAKPTQPETPCQAMRSVGMLGAHRLADTMNFGLPQRRTRAYMIYFRCGLGDAARAIATMTMFETEMLPLANFLEQLPKDTQPQKKARAAAGQKWQQRFRDCRTMWSLTAKVVDEQEALLKQNPWYANLTPRVQKGLALMLARLAPSRTTSAVPIVLQYDQDPPRMPHGVGFVPCVTPNGQYWYCDAAGPSHHRPLMATELSSLQGVGPLELAQFKAGDVDPQLLKDLSGNAFSAPVCMAAVLSMMSEWARKA